jgi:TPR repeat protein
MYEKGFNQPKNAKKAVEWYKIGAERGDRYGQYNLGWSYEYGEGVAVDVSQAIRWYQKAANQGLEDAKEALERLASSKAAQPPKETASTSEEDDGQSGAYSENSELNSEEYENIAIAKNDVYKINKEQENRNICLSGKNPDMCDLSLLNGTDMSVSVQAQISECKRVYKQNNFEYMPKYCERFPRKAIR